MAWSTYWVSLFFIFGARFVTAMRMGKSRTFADLDVRHAASDKEEANRDRLTCLRQDNLDLVLPASVSSDDIIRMLVPTQADSTSRDVYVSAKEIQIKELEVTVNLRRVGEDSFAFEVIGDREMLGHTQVASVRFWLSGMNVATTSAALDWATSLMTDRNELKEGQSGELNFKLAGTVRAGVNPTTGERELQLENTTAKPFEFDFTNQYILEKALTSYGGIDKVLLDQVILPVIKAALPVSLIASFQYVEQKDLMVSASAKVSGSMKEPNGPLELDVQVSSSAGLVPAQVLQVFMDHFNISELATAQVDRLLQNEELQHTWRNKRGDFIKTLKQYGFSDGLGLGFHDLLKEADDIEDLRPQLLEIAKRSADSMTKAMQPFVQAYAAGDEEVFEGLVLSLAAQLQWNKSSSDGGMISGQLKAGPDTWSIQGANLSPRAPIASTMQQMFSGKFKAASDEFIVLPGHFRKAIMQMDNVRLKGDATQTDLEFRRGHLKIGGMEFSNFDVEVLPQPAENETEVAVPQHWQLDGAAKEFSLSLPQAWDPGFAISMPYTRVECQGDGTIIASVGENGMQFQQVPKAQASTSVSGAKLRTGADTALDGTLPAEFARPTEKGPVMELSALAPSLLGDAAIQVKGHGGKLSAMISASARTTIDIASAMKGALAKRPAEDFGYVFYSDIFERHVRDGESGVPGESNVTAVVSCGFLRLLDLDIEPGVQRLQFKSSKKHQLELDLTEYNGKPSVVDNCVVLYSSGYAARTKGGGWFGSASDVDERLCGPAEKVNQLARAIELQAKRFADARAEAWDYGTHPAGSAQFMLPDGHVTRGIEVVASAGGDAVEQQAVGDAVGDAVGRVVMRALLEQQAVGDAVAESALLEQQAAHKTQETDVVETQPSSFTTALEKEWLTDAPMSHARKSCKAQEMLDQKYYPPEQHANKSVRLAIAGLPGVGDLFLVLDSIQVTDVNLELKIERKSDDSFILSVEGMVLAWVEGMDFILPGSAVDEVAKAAASFENVFSFSYTKLDKGPVNVTLNMSTEVRTDDKGEWAVVNGTSKQDADLRFGAGGVLNTIMNLIINGAGNIDQIFFDRVWPIVMLMIPKTLGKAFEQIPHSSAQLSHHTRILGKCPDSVDRRCPSEELKLNIWDETNVEVSPEPLIKDLKKSPEFDSIDWMLNNILEAYARDEPVFAGSWMHANTLADLSSDQKLVIGASAKASVPIGLIHGFLGSGSTVLNFIPDDGTLSASGSFELKDGVLKVPKISAKNIQFPFATASGEEALQLNVILGPLTARRMNAPADDQLFGSQSPFAVHAPDYNIEIAKEAGLAAEFTGSSDGSNDSVALREQLAGGESEDSFFSMHIAQSYVRQLLTAATSNTRFPVSARTASPDLADGDIPLRFRRPFARTPGQLDLSRLLKTVTVGVTAERPTKLSEELFIAKLGVSANVTLRLDQQFWHGVVDSKDADHGYLHYTISGRYGELKSNGKKLNPRRVIVQLSCGTLNIYPVSSMSGKTATYRNLEFTYDLFTNQEFGVGELKTVEGETCLQMGSRKGSWLFSPTTPQYFCSSLKEITAFKTALDIQYMRFKDARVQVARAIKSGTVLKKNLEDWSPDGSWFKQFNPYDMTTVFPSRYPPKSDAEVASPLTQWQRAFVALH